MAASIDSRRRSALAVAREILQNDGPKGFVRGLSPVLLRAFPVNASALFVYESLMRLLNAERVSRNLFHMVTLLTVNRLSNIRRHRRGTDTASFF